MLYRCVLEKTRICFRSSDLDGSEWKIFTCNRRRLQISHPITCNPSIHIIYIHTYILLCMTFLHDL